MKNIILTIASLFIISVSFAQDSLYTIPATKIKVASWVIVNKKTGAKTPYHLHWKKVKSGYIIKEPNGMYIVNGKEMFLYEYKNSSITIK